MITRAEYELLKYLPKGSLSDVAENTSLGDGAYSIANSLQKKGLVKIDERIERIVQLTDEGRKYLEDGLPEKRALCALECGARPVSSFGEEAPIVVMWLKRKGWAELSSGKLELTKDGKEACKLQSPEEKMLKRLGAGGVGSEELSEDPELINTLKDRCIVDIRESKVLDAKLTDKGDAMLKNPVFEEEGLSSVTHEMLKNGSWRDKKFRRYGIRDAEEIWPARAHPLKIAIDKIRRIFLEMGFEETEGNFIESSFWNFDALFQPQDHPARDLADTFYLDDLGHELPPQHREVSKMHESGGDIESIGWRYPWSKEVAKQAVLRTHTTSLSAQNLTRAKIPSKMFSVGRVFRNESLDYKHLAEFYQVEGIVVSEEVNFKNLLWYLKEFYKKLGFKKIRFRPAYFPYTEMSCEPEVYFEERGEWVELGGSGIFRPEVVKPLLGVECPVLAWGLGIERPLMLQMGLGDLRTFYRNDLDWLREYKTDEVL